MKRRLAGSVLIFEAIVIILAIPVAINVAGVDPAPAIIGGMGLAVAAIVVAARVDRPGGVIAGWIVLFIVRRKTPKEEEPEPVEESEEGLEEAPDALSGESLEEEWSEEDERLMEEGESAEEVTDEEGEASVNDETAEEDEEAPSDEGDEGEMEEDEESFPEFEEDSQESEDKPKTGE